MATIYRCRSEVMLVGTSKPRSVLITQWTLKKKLICGSLCIGALQIIGDSKGGHAGAVEQAKE